MQLALSDITQFSHDLHRPEGAMVTRDGIVWAADERGGCARITADGEHTLVGELGGMPNGICIDTNGDVIVANIGNGQVQRLRPDGSHEVLATHADGRALKAPNFPYVDSKGRIWVSHSTDAEPRRPAIWEPRPDGAIAVIENGRARSLLPRCTSSTASRWTPMRNTCTSPKPRPFASCASRYALTAPLVPASSSVHTSGKFIPRRLFV